MDSNKDFIKLKSLVIEVFGVKDISYDTEINNLKTLSEDNDRFIDLFQSEFKIDMSSFPSESEGFEPAVPLYMGLNSVKSYKRTTR